MFTLKSRRTTPSRTSHLVLPLTPMQPIRKWRGRPSCDGKKKNMLDFSCQEVYNFWVWARFSQQVSPLPTCCPRPGWRPSSRVAPPSSSLPRHRCRPAACLTGRRSKVRQGFYMFSVRKLLNTCKFSVCLVEEIIILFGPNWPKNCLEAEITRQ